MHDSYLSIFYAKRGTGMKKYTFATSGGSDQYELCMHGVDIFVTFFNHGGRLGPRVRDVTFFGSNEFR